MWTRRRFLERSAAAALGALTLPASACHRFPGRDTGGWVNDIHSRLNRTHVRRVVRPGSVAELADAVRSARGDGTAVSIAAGRHAMGGQQFGTDTLLIDMNGLARVNRFDPAAGEIEVEAGLQWPELIAYLNAVQAEAAHPLGIVQKQTGADRLSLGGALAANAHGRGLRLAPMAADVTAFSLVDPRGELVSCSRSENAELFRLALGGYGLFGPIATLRLRLAPRRKLERIVEVIDADALGRRFAERVEAGFLFGDFQYSTDVDGEGLLERGVFSCYRPVEDERPVPPQTRRLAREEWLELIRLAHLDRRAAFESYARYYLSTSGQLYWSDTHQLSTYIDDYHTVLAPALGRLAQGSEMISELYVPRDALALFLADVRQDFREHDVNLIYGTVRLIERDEDTFLAWARQAYACVIFNLHTQHDAASLRKTAEDFRRLIDRALAYEGSYFLTYHRWARRDQVLACYPQLPEFLRWKERLDPEQRFQSDWYRHHRALLS